MDNADAIAEILEQALTPAADWSLPVRRWTYLGCRCRARKGIELDNVYCLDNRINAENCNRIISGIEIDDDRTVTIWVLPYHPHDMHVMSRWKPSVRTPIRHQSGVASRTFRLTPK